MTLSAGTRLGPYAILLPLGAGGMGEVYRARDERLGRDVAIKVLPESLASDKERLKRFEKEARSASALNHPNIVTIHDIGSETGVSYIAMELVEGTTLRELLANGPLPIKKLLQVAPQIAEGLARAHEAGIVHRDLKPENVMVKKDGLVKILDFGLAKLSSTGSGSGEGSQLPTMTGTQPGVVVGTVSYMSPEQASGQTVDSRSDQFALGSMLYEIATGKRAFQRKTAIDTLAAILNEEPEAAGTLNPQTPAPLRWIVERCLQKEPDGRYASTKDLARELAGLRDHLSEASSVFTVRTDSVASTPIGLSRSDVLSVSSKGELAVLIKERFVGSPGSAGTLARVALSGGTPRELLESVIAADWAPNGEDLAIVRSLADGRYSVEYPIGTTLFESPTLEPQFIRVSPDGELVVLVGGDGIFTVDRKGQRRVVLSGWASIFGPSWSPDGREVFFSGGRTASEHAIHAVSLSGSVRVVMSNGYGLALHDVSSDGRLLIEDFRQRGGIAYLAGGEQREHQLEKMQDTRVRAISSDGKLILYKGSADPLGLYLQKSDGTPGVRLGEGDPQALSADGRWVLLLGSGSPPQPLVMLPTGPGTARTIPVEGFRPEGADLLPGGKGFLLGGLGPKGDVIMAVVGPDGGKPKLVTVEGIAPSQAECLSPEGDLMAYVTKEHGIRIVPLAGGPGSTVPGDPIQPNETLLTWSDDGRFIYVVRNGEIPLSIDRVELSSGRRDSWKKLIPEDRTAVIEVDPAVIAPDGRSYAYSYTRSYVDDLYVVDGVR